MAYLFVIGTLCCLADLLFNMIIKFVLPWLLSEPETNSPVRTNLVEIKKEMNSISMVDEFARYAKLQRKYIKLEGELKEKMNERLTKKLKLKLTLTYGSRFLNGIITSILLFKYGREPVIIYPEDMLWPVGGFLRWPSVHDNCISFLMWIAIMRITAAKFNNMNLNMDFSQTSAVEKKCK